MKRAFIALLLLSMPIAASHADSSREPTAKRVALVFDDGPVPEQADKLLKLFEAEGIHVTFAQVASVMREHPETSRRTAAAGHEIVNHSHDHRHSSELSLDELRHEIGGAQTAITNILGKAPRWYWPPYLELNDRVRAEARAAGATLYSYHNLVSSEDWNREVSAAEIRRRATTGVTDGSVILFHEWREETYQELPAIIADLRRQNCVFLTFSELQRAVARGAATRVR